MAVHDRVSVRSQLLLSSSVMLLSSPRVRVWIPIPHVTEQGDQSDHSAYSHVSERKKIFTDLGFFFLAFPYSCSVLGYT